MTNPFNDDAILNEQNLSDCHEALRIAAVLGYPVKAIAGSAVHIATIIVRDPSTNNNSPFLILGVFTEEETAWETLLNWVEDCWEIEGKYPWLDNGEEFDSNSQEFMDKRREYLQSMSVKEIVEEYSNNDYMHEYFVQSYSVRNEAVALIKF